MATIETKIAKNGAINFYNAETGKRVAEASVVEDAIENGGTFYTAHVHGYDVDHVCTKYFASPITAYKWICRMARKSTTYADGDAQIVVGFNGEEIYTQKMATAAIKNDELRAYMEAEEAPYVAESLRQEREDQIVLQMSHRNITREQAEELVDYLSANRENYSNEVAATVKAMLDNFKKINNPEPATVEETANAETEPVEVKTASEMKAAYAASRNVVRVHFTAKGNPAWQSIYHYGLNDRETGYQRISEKIAAAALAKFGLTTEQVIAVEKAQDAINAEEREACKAARAEGRCYTRLNAQEVYGKALAMVFGEDAPAAEETIIETDGSEDDTDDNEVFNLLPGVDDLNDVDDAIGMDAAEYTDRDDRYNRGEKIAAALTAKLRPFDPTVEVTFAINDDEDTYYLSYDGISRTPFTATGVEASFHAMKQYDAETDCPPESPAPVKLPSELPTLKPDSPLAIADGLNDIFQKTFHKVNAPYMDIITQDGAKIVDCFGAAYISVDWRTTDGYVFGNHYDEVLARYDTPQQIIDVMTALRDAINRGDTEFEFPTVEDLTIAEKIAAENAEREANQPAEVKALNAELAASELQAPNMWVKITDGKTGFHFGSFTRGVLSGVRVYHDAVNKYGVFYFGKPMRLYDTFAQVTAAVEQFKAAIINNAKEFTFPTIEELTKPEVDKSATADSLTRAMTIALEHYQGFCRVGNLTAATNELSLYNICRKAMTELWKERTA